MGNSCNPNNGSQRQEASLGYIPETISNIKHMLSVSFQFLSTDPNSKPSHLLADHWKLAACEGCLGKLRRNFLPVHFSSVSLLRMLTSRVADISIASLFHSRVSAFYPLPADFRLSL